MSKLIQIPYHGYLNGNPISLSLFLTDENGNPSLFMYDRKPIYADQLSNIRCLWNEYKVKFANLVNDLVALNVFSVYNVNVGNRKVTVDGNFPVNGSYLACICCTEDNLYSNISISMSDLENLLEAVKNGQEF